MERERHIRHMGKERYMGWKRGTWEGEIHGVEERHMGRERYMG